MVPFAKSTGVMDHAQHVVKCQHSFSCPLQSLPECQDPGGHRKQPQSPEGKLDLTAVFSIHLYTQYLDILGKTKQLISDLNGFMEQKRY